MANTCIVYGKALTLHRVSNSVAKLAKITALYLTFEKGPG